MPRRHVIPAGSTPSEKEHGLWVKLTRAEAVWLFSVVSCIQIHVNLSPEAEKIRQSCDKKLREAVGQYAA